MRTTAQDPGLPHKTYLQAASTALALAILLVPVVLASRSVQAQTFNVLYNFGGVPGDPTGFYLPGLVAQGRDGNLYTTSYEGGTLNSGTAFTITTGGTLTVVSSFAAGDYNYLFNYDGGLTLGTDGYFYGTNVSYGADNFGSVFNLSSSGRLTTLYSFTCGSDDAYPYAPPIQGLDGNLYGTTRGGCNGGRGSVYKLTPVGQITSLYLFDGIQGGYPYAPLIQGVDGNFYGTTSANGTCCGSVFKITPAGVFATLHFFDGTHGGYPYSPLVQGNDGNFYGTAAFGGKYHEGVVFKLTAAGVYSVLSNLTGLAIYPYSGLVQASDGNFYGTTYQDDVTMDGTIFRVTPGGTFSVLYNFDGTTGSNPEATLVQHTNGILYGETLNGGAYNGGVFFSLDVGAPPFIRVLPFASRVGKPAEILGQGLTGTSNVAFNGVSATFTVKSDTFLTVTIPVGATTGFVTVTTPTGTLTSNQKFWVRR